MIFAHFGPCCASARRYRAAGLRGKPSRATSARHPLSLWERVRARDDRADERAQIVRVLERRHPAAAINNAVGTLERAVILGRRPAPACVLLAVTARIANARRLGRGA